MTPAFWTFYFRQYCNSEDQNTRYAKRARQAEWNITKEMFLDEYWEEASADAKEHFEKLSRLGRRAAVTAYMRKMRKDVRHIAKEAKAVREWRRKN